MPEEIIPPAAEAAPAAPAVEAVAKPPLVITYFSLRTEEETVSGYLDDFGSFELRSGVDYAGPSELLEWIRRHQITHLEFSDLKKWEKVEFIAPPSPEAADALVPELPDGDEPSPNDDEPSPNEGGAAPAPDTPPLTPISDILGG